MRKDQLSPGQVVNHTTHGQYVFLATDGRWFYFTRGIKVLESELYLFELENRSPLEEVYLSVETSAKLWNMLIDKNSLENFLGGEIVLVNENGIDKVLVVKSVDIALELIICTNGISYDVNKFRIFCTGFTAPLI